MITQNILHGMFATYCQRIVLILMIWLFCFLLRQNRCWSRWHSVQRLKLQSISVIQCVCLRLFILQITVKITVFTVVSTVLIKLKEESFQWKRSKRSTKLFQKPDFVKFFCLQESQKPLLQLNILQTL